MTVFITALHVIVCILLIVVVLLQRGKGAEAGAVFGGGGSTTMFGSRGAGNFLTRLTTGAAVIFMLTSLTLAYVGQQGAEDTLFEEETTEASDSPFAEPGAVAVPEAAEAVEPGGSGFEEVVPAPEPEAPAAEPEAPSEGEPTP